MQRCVTGGGVALIAAYKYLRPKLAASCAKTDNKTNVYESEKVLNEYLNFHYGGQQTNCLQADHPKNCFDFPLRCAELCMRHFNDAVGHATLIYILDIILTVFQPTQIACYLPFCLILYPGEGERQTLRWMGHFHHASPFPDWFQVLRMNIRDHGYFCWMKRMIGYNSPRWPSIANKEHALCWYLG